MQLPGAVVVVTGGTRGIGRSTALLLGERGARPLVVGRDAAAAREVAGATGGSWLAVDLRAEQAAEQVVAAALERHGRLDAVVANAGVGWAGDVAGMSAEQVSELVELNVRAPLLLARASLPTLLEQGHGALVFVTSIAGALGVPGESVYSATKAAVESFADVLREEVRPRGVAVSTVLPGVVRTGFFDTRGAPYERRVPRPIAPERVAAAVVEVLETGAPRRVVPRWLAVPARVRAWAPQTYRRLERRFG